MKIGVTTNVSSGTVTNPTLSIGGLSNMVGTNLFGAGGDSGGIVFTGIDPLNPFGNTAGIVTGGIGQFTNTMFFTRASNILAAFGLTRY